MRARVANALTALVMVVVIALLVPVVLVLAALCWAKPEGRRKWQWNLLIGIDQLAHAAVGGDPDETLSSRAAKATARNGWWRLAQLLERIDPGHGERTREDDEGKDRAFFVNLEEER